jgi:hypothetical protein
MATRPRKASVQRTLKKSIVSTLKKAFGQDAHIHIKDSGPSWDNDPKGRPRPPDIVALKKGIRVSVKTGRSK